MCTVNVDYVKNKVTMKRTKQELMALIYFYSYSSVAQNDVLSW